MATATTVQESEVDTLGHLEERIHRAVALVTRLRQEKDAALQEFATTRTALEESQSANARLSGEVESLRAERTKVRKRLEKLLEQIDQLGGA